MLFAPGELTNRSPFGAYTIMRGARRSAAVVTVKPFAAFGLMPSGRETARLGFGLAVAGVRQCAWRAAVAPSVFCCATRTLVASTMAARPANVLTIDLMQ